MAAEVLGDAGPQLRLLTAAALLVLLIACVNVAALALARTGARSRELAIRTAFGGGRGALRRLLGAECLVLGIGAGALGLGAATLLVRWLRVSGQDLLPRAGELAVDPFAMMAAVVLSLLLIVGLGLVPALRGESFTDALRDGIGGGTGPTPRRLRAALALSILKLDCGVS